MSVTQNLDASNCNALDKKNQTSYQNLKPLTFWLSLISSWDFCSACYRLWLWLVFRVAECTTWRWQRVMPMVSNFWHNRSQSQITSFIVDVVAPILKKVFTVALGCVLTFNTLLPAQALTKAQLSSLSYEQVKGTGLANRCPDVVGEQSIALKNGQKYKITDFCMEPTSWQVNKTTSTQPHPLSLWQRLLTHLHHNAGGTRERRSSRQSSERIRQN